MGTTKNGPVVVVVPPSETPASKLAAKIAERNRQNEADAAKLAAYGIVERILAVFANVTNPYVRAAWDAYIALKDVKAGDGMGTPKGPIDFRAGDAEYKLFGHTIGSKATEIIAAIHGIPVGDVEARAHLTDGVSVPNQLSTTHYLAVWDALGDNAIQRLPDGTETPMSVAIRQMSYISRMSRGTRAKVLPPTDIETIRANVERAIA